MIADIHEPVQIVERLRDLGAPVDVRALAPGDYVVGETGVERKSVHDFFSSLVKGRLFEQVRRLRETYPAALVLVEGDLAAVSEFRNPRSIWGAFLSLAFDERIPVLFTPDREGTAMALYTLWRRGAPREREYGLRHRPKMATVEERQRYAVEGLPGVGETLARSLLERFGSVRRVMAATEGEMRRVPKIGPAKAAEIARVLDAPYAKRTAQLDT